MDADLPKVRTWGLQRTALTGARWPPETRVANSGRTAKDLIALYLAANRELIENSGQAVLEAMGFATEHGAVVPKWLATAFSARLHDFAFYRAETLDEAFGVAPIGKKAFKTHQRWNEMRRKVTQALEAALVADPFRSIDQTLFEKVAESLGISASHCYELYRAAVDRFEQDDLKVFRDQQRVV